MIHKASQGQSYRDPTYKARRKRAADAGILWGAYHFGTGSNGIAQAENFLQSVGDPAGVMMVLDFESNLGGPSMTLEEARALFLGQGDPSVQVWVYASGEDLQQVFDHFVMEGRMVTSSASIAATPQQMSDTLVNTPNTVGILPRHWKVGDSRQVFSVATVPVLAISLKEPQGVIKALIACLQK